MKEPCAVPSDRDEFVAVRFGFPDDRETKVLRHPNPHRDNRDESEQMPEAEAEFHLDPQNPNVSNQIESNTTANQLKSNTTGNNATIPTTTLITVRTLLIHVRVAVVSQGAFVASYGFSSIAFDLGMKFNPFDEVDPGPRCYDNHDQDNREDVPELHRTGPSSSPNDYHGTRQTERQP